MFFKKKKIKVQQSKLPSILAILGGVCVFFLGILIVSASQKLNFEIFNFQNQIPNTTGSIEPGESIHQDTPSSDVTYILLLGRGGGNHDAPNLTDTIILAGLNKKNETITLFSIPRDLWVKYPSGNQSGKINGIYESSLYLGEKIAIERIKTKITEITGKNIDYYMNVDFTGFIEVIDALGGVEVTLEENFVDYEYPDGNLGYKTFILRKGTWTLDGEVALMYARSRHSTSDFDRSLRQQEILSSIKQKVSSLGYLKDSKKILSLYNIFTQYVETDMSLTDMVKIGLELKSWDDSSMLSYNLNDSCYNGSPRCFAGGFLYVPLREYFNGASVLLPNTSLAANPGDYSEIQKFSEYIYDYSNVFKENKKIIIYNGTGVPLLAGTLADTLNSYGFNLDSSANTMTLPAAEKKFENSILLYNKETNIESVLEILKDFIEIDVMAVEKSELISQDADIEIILMDKNDI